MLNEERERCLMNSCQRKTVVNNDMSSPVCHVQVIFCSLSTGAYLSLVWPSFLNIYSSPHAHLNLKLNLYPQSGFRKSEALYCLVVCCRLNLVQHNSDSTNTIWMRASLSQIMTALMLTNSTVPLVSNSVCVRSL